MASTESFDNLFENIHKVVQPWIPKNGLLRDIEFNQILHQLKQELFTTHDKPISNSNILLIYQEKMLNPTINQFQQALLMTNTSSSSSSSSSSSTTTSSSPAISFNIPQLKQTYTILELFWLITLKPSLESFGKYKLRESTLPKSILFPESLCNHLSIHSTIVSTNQTSYIKLLEYTNLFFSFVYHPLLMNLILPRCLPRLLYAYFTLYSLITDTSIQLSIAKDLEYILLINSKVLLSFSSDTNTTINNMKDIQDIQILRQQLQPTLLTLSTIPYVTSQYYTIVFQALRSFTNVPATSLYRQWIPKAMSMILLSSSQALLAMIMSFLDGKFLCVFSLFHFCDLFLFPFLFVWFRIL